MKDQLYDLFIRNLPYAVREKETALEILGNPENRVFFRADENGSLFAAAVVHKSNILLLCVDEAHRGKGIGSELLSEAEKYIKAGGYDEVSVGVGDNYLCPGVPVKEMPFLQEIANMDVNPAIPPDNAAFFVKRGYVHDWEDCNCFDMRMPLTSDIEKKALFDTPGISYRWAEKADIPAIIDCVNEAEPDFSEYYKEEDAYEADCVNKILIALDKELVVGTLMVDQETEGAGVGSIGCTTVRPSHQGRKIASNMILRGAKHLYASGMKEGFLGYTYSGLDRLYGYAGYRVCAFYFMAKKPLA